MSEKQRHIKFGIRKFYPQGVVRWLWLLTITLGLAGMNLFFAPVWAVLAPSPIAVDTQVKVKFSAFNINKRSNTYGGKTDQS